MAIDNQNLVNYVSKNKFDANILQSTIQDISLIVIKRYYQQCMFDDEILAIGRYKALLLLNSEYANGQKNLVNFLFTGIRNEIGNTIKRNGKERDIMVDYNEAIYYDSFSFRHYTSEREALGRIQDNLKVILDNLELLGIDLSTFFDRFFNDPDESKLGTYGGFALRSAICRSLLQRR